MIIKAYVLEQRFIEKSNKLSQNYQKLLNNSSALLVFTFAFVFDFRCLKWRLPSVCTLDPPAAGKCCRTPNCPPDVVINYPPGYGPEAESGTTGTGTGRTQSTAGNGGKRKITESGSTGPKRETVLTGSTGIDSGTLGRPGNLKQIAFVFFVCLFFFFFFFFFLLFFCFFFVLFCFLFVCFLLLFFFFFCLFFFFFFLFVFLLLFRESKT